MVGIVSVQTNVNAHLGSRDHIAKWMLMNVTWSRVVLSPRVLICLAGTIVTAGTDTGLITILWTDHIHVWMKMSVNQTILAIQTLSAGTHWADTHVCASLEHHVLVHASLTVHTYKTGPAGRRDAVCVYVYRARCPVPR